ncbi:MAG: 3-phosphoshikimate 1-carboxyvinyltransferase [Erysipelotrichaceae bacterium]
MIVNIDSFKLKGNLAVVPSKSILHRVLIIAALAKGCCRIDNVVYSDDVLATINCLESLNCRIDKQQDYLLLDSRCFLQQIKGPLQVNQSGSTLRFFIALSLLLNQPISFVGQESLFNRPLDYYQKLAKQNNFLFEKQSNSLTVKGLLDLDYYEVEANISSQYVSALMMALASLNKDVTIKLVGEVVSKGYIEMTQTILAQFGCQLTIEGSYIYIKKSKLQIRDYYIEPDMSNMAYIDCFNYLGSKLQLTNDISNSIQADKKYRQYFEQITKGYCQIDVEDNIDLALILLVLASQYHGVCLTNTSRLAYKESDRALCLKKQFNKLNMDFEIADNRIICPKQKIFPPTIAIDGCNDHRIVMAMTVLLSLCGGTISGFEAINKSYPTYLADLQRSGAKITVAER